MHSRYPLLGAALCAAFTYLLGCSTTSAQDTTARAHGFDQSAVLPLERVRLYASGVGYFERGGQLRAGQRALPVPAGHLDDALKSLVVFNENEALGAITFPSRLSPAVARARAGLPADQEAVLSYDRLLVSLRGEEVELSLKASEGQGETVIRGRVIDVVAVQPNHPSYDHGLPNQTLGEDQQEAEDKERLQVLLLSEPGEILRLDASELKTVRALDEIVARRLNAALSARLATRSNQYQLLELAGGTGAATSVTLAYLAETPTWRASYRLLLGDATAARATSRLQSWALVHNDTDEHWQSVQLELVDGRPNSFLFPMTAPRYERRQLETPERELSSVPQLSTTTPDALWGDFSDYQGEQIARVGSEGLSGYGEGGGGYGHGSGAGSVGTLGHGSGAGFQGDDGSDLLWVGDLALRAGVVPTAEQTTSVHRVKTALTLPPQHSAMVPFMDTHVAAAPIVWFDGFSAPAERAVGINNDTPRTLPAGPLSVYGRGGFLGEAMLTSLKPGARQFARISDEPDAAISSTRAPSESVSKHIDYRDERLRTHLISTSTIRLSFDNQSGSTRRAYVALPVVLNATVSGCDDVDYETTSGRAFAVFDLPAGNDQERVITTREGVTRGVDLFDLTAHELDEMIGTVSVPQGEREVLGRARPLLLAWQDARKEEEVLEREADVLRAENERLKEHLETLAKSESGSAHSQLMQRILELEGQASELSKRQQKQGEVSAQRKQDLENGLSQLDAFRDAIVAERKRAQAEDPSSRGDDPNRATPQPASTPDPAR